MRRRLAVHALLLVNLGGCKFSCSVGGKTVNASDLQVQVGARLAELGVTTTGVTCPGGTKVERDTVFRCQAEVDGTRHDVRIIIGEVDGEKFQFEMRLDDLLVRSRLEQVLTPTVREQTAPDVAVRCGARQLIPRPADGVVWCDIGDGTKAAKIRVEVDPELNVTSWKVADPSAPTPTTPPAEQSPATP